ncbi:MAG TPA: tetratricopeptide repeat protein [Candidatus Acidoferrum sp.]|nr:tetratricopeptide repeat protein [Candidatus Acidoferrum sp.]
MKRAAIIIAVLGVCVWSFGQDKPAAQNPPAGQTAGQAAAPQGKRPPQAKTQPEFEAYKAAVAQTDPAALEKAADDFSTKFPQSELRVLLYTGAMQRYQQANNANKMIDMGHKVLEIDPDDPSALVGVAQGIAEQTHDTDLDKDQKNGEAKKDAERALITVDTDVPTSGYPPEKLAQYKNFLRSEAYTVLGTIAFKGSDWPNAETSLRKSIDVFPEQPDTIAVFRLAVALDMQNKIPEALKYANQAVELTKDHPDTGAGKAARDELDRLNKLNSGAAPGQSAPK